MKHKKGGLPDGIFLIVALFAIAIVFIFSFKLMDDINTNMQGSPGISDRGKVLVQESKDKYLNILDQAYLFLFIGLSMAIIIGAFFIKTHPALFWFSVPILVFIIFIAAIFGNIYQEISETEQVQSYANQFIFINFIFDNFLYFLVGIILLLSFALFAKSPET